MAWFQKVKDLTKSNQQLRCEVQHLKKENADLHAETQKWHNKYYLLRQALREFVDQECDES